MIMNRFAWILKRVFDMTWWRNPDGSYGANVRYTKQSDPITFENLTIEWVMRDIEHSLIAIEHE